MRASVELRLHWGFAPDSRGFRLRLIEQLPAPPFNRSPEFGKLFHLVTTIEGNRIYAPDPSLLAASAAR